MLRSCLEADFIWHTQCAALTGNVTSFVKKAAVVTFLFESC